MNHSWTDTDQTVAPRTPRAAERTPITLPARLTWKDRRGTTRFASVVTRDVSEMGVYVECHSGVSIPLYRLVQLQLESQGRQLEGVPAALASGRVLSAVYRVSPATASGRRLGYGLRLIVDPRRKTAPLTQREAVRASA